MDTKNGWEIQKQRSQGPKIKRLTDRQTHP